MRSLCTIALLLGLPGGATVDAEAATASAPPPAGRALAPIARQVVLAGLTRLGPALRERILDGLEEGAEARTILSRELHESGMGELDAVYGDRLRLVAPTGLRAPGRAVEAALEGARWHAIDVTLPEAVRALAPERTPTWPDASPEHLVEAWDEARRIEVANARGTLLDGVARALAGRLGWEVERGLTPRARAEAEAALLVGLSTLVGELPARPREAAVLIEPTHGYYLSPDVTWQARPPQEADAGALAAALEAAHAGGLEAHLRALEPAHPQYAALVAAAERYHALCRAGPWPAVPVPKNPREARSGEAVRALQARLMAEGLFAGPASGEWDEATAAAVSEVRRIRHLKPWGEPFDKALVEVLAVPCEERLQTLLLNVRRWRVSAWRGEAESVQVNLAGQVLRYFRGGELVMSQRTIVGSDRSYFNNFLGRRHWRNATPILADRISTVIVNPEWNVPPRIAREEIEKAIAEDPDYLEKHRFRTRVGGDGATYYTQEPGPGNALGRIKILFPNSESVYLHDTPGRAAFKLPVRALSHGCVRVDNAVDFGVELVRADREKRGEELDSRFADQVAWLARNSTKMKVFELGEEIPVFLEYYTASQDESGALWFHPDIYGYDAEILERAVAQEP